MKNLKYLIVAFIFCFVLLSEVRAEAVCVYKQSDFKVTCTANNNRVSCTNNSIGDINFNYSKISLSYDVFVSGSSFKCPDQIYVELFQATGSSIIEIRDIASTSSSNRLGLNIVKSESKVNGQAQGNNDSKDYESDPDYIAAKADAELYCNPHNIAYQDDAKCKEAQDKMNSIKNLYVSGDTEGDGSLDIDNPCQGRVLGVFTTIGWAFFVIKIVVPIMLIIFGTIDVSKAVVSSKDDEIKKSVKTLVIRAIAGIIIFFIPTVLSFVVDVIGNRASDVYNNKFSNCTKCMLKPNQSACTTLVGGN